MQIIRNVALSKKNDLFLCKIQISSIINAHYCKYKFESSYLLSKHHQCKQKVVLLSKFMLIKYIIDNSDIVSQMQVHIHIRLQQNK